MHDLIHGDRTFRSIMSLEYVQDTATCFDRCVCIDGPDRRQLAGYVSNLNLEKISIRAINLGNGFKIIQ